MEFEYSLGQAGVSVAYTSFLAMNTMMEIIIPRVPKAQAQIMSERIEELVYKIEYKLSRHIRGGALETVNTQGFQNFIKTDEETYMVLELCETMRKATGGYFDIAVLSTEKHRPAYTTDPKCKRVQLASGEVMLDLGGFAKGYTLDKIRRELEAADIVDALINFGNSSIMGIGSHPFGNSWQVGLEASSESFNLKDASLSVSGKSPVGKAHIVNPLTGKVVEWDEKVVITGRSALVCEILSTALYAAPKQERAKIISSFEGYNTFFR